MVLAIIAVVLLLAWVALRMHADEEDERRDAGAPPTPWRRQVLQVGLLAILGVVAVVITVLWYLVPELLF